MSLNPLSGLGGLGGLAGLSPAKSLSMLSGLGGAPAPGTNPMNPLQGQTAVTGIRQFVTQIMFTNSLRKLGLLPKTGGAAAPGGLGGDPAAAIGQLTSLLGQLGGGAGVVG